MRENMTIYHITHSILFVLFAHFPSSLASLQRYSEEALNRSREETFNRIKDKLIIYSTIKLWKANGSWIKVGSIGSILVCIQITPAVIPT